MVHAITFYMISNMGKVNIIHALLTESLSDCNKVSFATTFATVFIYNALSG